MFFFRLIACFTMLIFIAGCSNFGATQLPPDRLSYNASLQYSDNQQMLLNIVRLRYTDELYFLSVNNVVSQFSLSKSLDLNVANNTAPPPAISASGDANISLSESPTITYTPLQGEDYITKLLTPVDLSVLYMLMRAGWGANQVFRLLIQRLGHMQNAILASRTTSSRIPKYKEFQKFGLMLRDMQYADILEVTPDQINGKFAIKLTITNFAKVKPRYLSLLARHGINAKSPMVWMVSDPSQQKNHIFVQTRTLLGVFNYLSKGVDVPAEDIRRHLVPMTYTKDGQIFDWRKITVGQIKVRNSKSKPTNGYLSVRYRGYWFYIADEDFDTKETLNILSILMGIYQGEIKSFLPVFTVS